MLEREGRGSEGDRRKRRQEETKENEKKRGEKKRRGKRCADVERVTFCFAITLFLREFTAGDLPRQVTGIG